MGGGVSVGIGVYVGVFVGGSSTRPYEGGSGVEGCSASAGGVWVAGGDDDRA